MNRYRMQGVRRTAKATVACGFGMLLAVGTLSAQDLSSSPVEPTLSDIAYAPAEPSDSRGHLLDLYLPKHEGARVPIVIYTGGSAWLADNGKIGARDFAAELLTAGFAVAGVSIRSSSQVQFPGQLYDIKAAIRWLRLNAGEYNYDPERMAIIGDSSGGWTAIMAAVTGDVPELEGDVGPSGVSSAVQAAVAFYPPTDFSTMDAWAVGRCDPAATLGEPGSAGLFCHASEGSPEARLVGCDSILDCEDAVQRANPLNYVSADDPAMLILHGNSDPLVPHNQGERLYQALNKACVSSMFISLPVAAHGPPVAFLTDSSLQQGATKRSTSRSDCSYSNPELYSPSWRTITDFLKVALSASEN